jgi:hypothetical protein
VLIRGLKESVDSPLKNCRIFILTKLYSLSSTFKVSVLPPVNNVYGYLYSKTGLQEVAKLLRSHLGLTEEEILIYKSRFDGNETLKIRLKACEFETQSLKEGNKWLFNGAVAGDIDSIEATLKTLSDPLHWAGYETSFEIYDENFDCISEYRSVPLA